MYFRGGWRREAAVLAGLAAFVLVLAAPALVPGPLPENSAKNTFENTAESTPRRRQAPYRRQPRRQPRRRLLPRSSPTARSGSPTGMAADGLFFGRSVRAEAAAMLDNIAGLGANVVLAQVRPFGMRSTQARSTRSATWQPHAGEDPGFDPLAILVEQAHARGLELEAWVNPYRLQAGGTPAALAGTNLATPAPTGSSPPAAGCILTRPAPMCVGTSPTA